MIRRKCLKVNTNLWEHECIKSSALVNLRKVLLRRKPTTTYTVIKRLSVHGLLQYKNTIITSFVSKTQTQTSAINEMVEKNIKVLCLHSLQLLQNIKRYLM